MELNWIKIYPIVGILILICTKSIEGVWGRWFKLLVLLVFAVLCLYYGGIYWGGDSGCGILYSQYFLEWHS
jgi:hypothetical protein